MAGVRIEFAQFGDFDSFSVYRSITPIDLSSLPIPIITGLKTMYVSDNTVVENTKYYYRIGVLRDGELIVSEEVSIVTKFGFKWWRLTNISNRINSAAGERSIAEIRFNNLQGIESNNPSKAFANSFLNSNYTPDKAFDGNVGTFAHGFADDVPGGAPRGFEWAIGYEFDEPVEVTSISLQARQDMNSSWGQEWQTADVEVSDNGVDWIKAGSINPMVSTMDLTLATFPIV